MSIRTAIVSSIFAILVVGIALLAFMQDDAQEKPAVSLESLPEGLTMETQDSFDFEVVASQEARAQGLSGRTDVPPGYGMLFVFDQPDRYGFWMKDMLVSIDIIWLANDGTILAIEENVSPSTYPKPFYPPQPVRLVLETRPGEANVQGWSVGTRLTLPL